MWWRLSSELVEKRRCADSANRPRPVEGQRLLSIAEAATVLGLSYFAVGRLLRAGAFPAVRIGRHRRVDRVDLDAWIERSKATPKRSRRRALDISSGSAENLPLPVTAPPREEV
ncbi:MAG: helix-turn-helix domain-containing protein [Planctomycetes bacterium]|nr:helix-turn-helix domain-containing protein [Planctomycetota bacterium]